MLRKSKKGFTLIEILVVAAIVGLMASVIIVMLNNARMKARDAKRYAEVDALKKALELYYDNNDKYPEVADWIKIEQDADENGPFSAAMRPYLSQMPRDPLYPKEDGASPKIFSYQYKSTTDAQGYKLHVEMETGTYFETSYEVYVGEGINLTYTPTPTPTVGSVTPNNGTTAGGTAVTISGSNFVNGAAVTFGGTPAIGVIVVSDTTITAITPAHAAGAMDVKVTNPDTQSGTLANGYTYVAVITYVRSGGVTGTSFSFNIGSAGTNRLVVVIAGDESSGINLSGVTVAGKSCNLVVRANNIVGAGNHQEMWYCDEDNLGSSSGSVTISITVTGGSGWAAHAHLYTGVNQSGPTNYQIDDTSALKYEILPAAVNIPANGLLVFGAGDGRELGNYNNNDWDTNPTQGTDDGLSPEIEMFEVTDSPNPASAVLATAYWISSTTTQTNRLFRAKGSAVNNRGAGIVATWNKAGAALPAPTVGSVTPNNGTTAGGTTVTINGGNFVNGAAVTFGGTPATGVIVVSDTTITAATPAHAAGAVDVKATNPDTQSGTLANGFTYVDWWNTNWPNRIKLTFNNSASVENLYDFPILVSLTSAEIDYAKTQNQGQDIRFVDTDNATQLKYEIEKWDETGTSVVWVKVPQIDAGSTTDFIWMYYNNPSAVYEQTLADEQAVWSSGFKMVQHLQEISGTHEDSTDQNNDGTAGGGVIQNAVGKIDGADEFAAIGEYVNTSDAGLSASSGTLEVWGKADDFDGQTSGYSYFFGHTGEIGFWTNRIQLYTNDTFGNLDLGLGDTHQRRENIQDLNVNTWYYIVLTWNGTNYEVFVDAISKASGTYTGLATIGYSTIGNDGNPSAYNEAFDGIIDEVRVSSIVRSADWIEAQYKSMNSTFVSFGSEESY